MNGLAWASHRPMAAAVVRRRRWLRVRTIAAGGVGLTLGALWLASCLVSRHGLTVVDRPGAAPAAHVVIVPGALVHRDGHLSQVLHDRLACALDAYRLGKAKVVLVSGDHATPGYDEVNAMRAWLVENGVPSEAVFMDHAGLRTHDTLQRAAKVFGVSSALVCTQDVFMDRTLYLARHAGLQATGIRCDRHELPATNWLRERAASLLAVFDAATDRGPAHLGPRIDLRGPAAATHDRWTSAVR